MGASSGKYRYQSRNVAIVSQTLTQLTSDEAKFLDYIWNGECRGLGLLSASVKQLMTHYAESIYDYKKGSNPQEFERKHVEPLYERYEIMLSDFERLGIIEKTLPSKFTLQPCTKLSPARSKRDLFIRSLHTAACSSDQSPLQELLNDHHGVKLSPWNEA